jgi:predicted RNA binding protein YcfA (HicA-like mRNA interferase family)
MNKEIIAMVQRQGFVLRRQRKHLVFKHPSGKVFVCGKTLSDRKALLNIQKEITRLLAK